MHTQTHERTRACTHKLVVYGLPSKKLDTVTGDQILNEDVCMCNICLSRRNFIIKIYEKNTENVSITLVK